MTHIKLKSSFRLLASLMFLTSLGLIACAPTDATGNPTSLSTAPPSEQTLPVPVSSLSSSDIEGRLSTLEGKVGTLEQDMSEAKPTLKKVAVIERQFRSLSLELDRIDQESMTGNIKTSQIIEPIETAPTTRGKKAAPRPVVKSNTSAPKAKSSPSVTNVRFGSQNEKTTRIVVDGSKAVAMTADLDNQEKILVLEIKGLDWKTAMSRSAIPSSLIQSYTAQNTLDGSRLVLQLKKAVRLGKVQTLGPEGSNGHRAFLDLTAQ
jgi:hypothetical protein